MKILTCTAFMIALLQINVGFAENGTPAEQPTNPLLKFVTNDTVGLILAKPRSLMEDTEQVVLGDLAYLGQFPVPPSEVENLAVVVRLHQSGPGFAIAFQFRRDIPETTLQQWLAPAAVKVQASAEAGSQGDAVPVYITPEEADSGTAWRTHLAIPSSRVAIVSFDKLLLGQMLRQAESGSADGTLVRHARNLDAKVNFSIMLDAGQIRMLLDSEMGQEAAALRILVPDELSLFSLESSFGRQSNDLLVRFKQRSDMPSSSAVKDWSRQLDGAIDRLLEPLVARLKSDLPTEIESGVDQHLGNLKQFFADLRPVASDEDVVFEAPAAPSFSRAVAYVTSLLSVQVQIARHSARRMMLSNNFKQIMLAWHNFHDAQKNLPGNIVDENDKPLLSWRVRILPFLSSDAATAIYKEFHLNEPWDSEHNIQLLSKMPLVYKDIWNSENLTETRIQSLTGEGTVMDGINTYGDIRDGTSNTITLVDAAQAVPWTKPADVPFGKKYSGFLPLSGRHLLSRFR